MSYLSECLAVLRKDGFHLSPPEQESRFVPVVSNQRIRTDAIQVAPIVRIIDPTEPLISSVTMIKDIVLAASSLDELRQNESATAIVQQMELMLPLLYRQISALEDGNHFLQILLIYVKMSNLSSFVLP